MLNSGRKAWLMPLQELDISTELMEDTMFQNPVKTSLQTQAHQLPNQSPHQALALLLPCENHHEKDLNMNYYLHHLTHFSAKSNHKAFLSVTKVHIL